MPTKTKKAALVDLLPITLSIAVNNETHVIKTDNILKSLKELKLDPRKIKTVARFDATYFDRKISTRIINVQRMKRLLMNDLVKMVTARQFTQALNAPRSNYE